jgi:hypothetical protein
MMMKVCRSCRESLSKLSRKFVDDVEKMLLMITKV